MSVGWAVRPGALDSELGIEDPVKVYRDEW